MEHLQTGRAFGLSILAGLVAGGVLAGINVAIVQSYTAVLADLEIENLLEEGEFDEEEFDIQLQSIYYSQLYGSVIIGLAAGTGLGGTFVAGKIRLSPFKAALLIAGIAWFVLYIIPTVKYPPSPTATFDPEMTGTYQTLLAGYTAVSGLAALGIAFGFRKINRKGKVLGAAALYLVVVAGAYFAFPPYPSEDDSLLPQPAISAWRSAISLSMNAFWFLLGIICGLLWTYGIKRPG
jgi:predicted cobalt transporter CbtA